MHLRLGAVLAEQPGKLYFKQYPTSILMIQNEVLNSEQALSRDIIERSPSHALIESRSSTCGPPSYRIQGSGTVNVNLERSYRVLDIGSPKVLDFGAWSPQWRAPLSTLSGRGVALPAALDPL